MGEESTAWAGGGESDKCKVTFGYAKVKGVRDHPIEDFHVACIQQYKGEEIGLFAVYDGHAGTEVASYLERELLDNILNHPEFPHNSKKAITDVYLDTDKKIMDKGAVHPGFRAGSTATTALLMEKGKRLIVANVGDSRACLSRGGKGINLTVDHEPNLPKERKMIEAKGGEVDLSPFGGVYRVDHRLNMSRAFGDFSIKEHLSVEPDIWDGALTSEDELFIVASDGLWKVMSTQDAVNIARRETNAERAAKALAAAALKLRSHDDIACLVVCLNSS